jgi:Spy/CpxP family protein refolding chaperone
VSGRKILIAGVALVAACFAMTALAQGPGGRGFGRGPGGGSGAMLLMMQEVQKELKITDEQKAKLEALGKEVGEKFRASFDRNAFQDFQNLSNEEREKRIAEMRKKMEGVTKEVDEKLTKILDAKQIERLKQLQLQREGAMALTRPEVVKKLGLSEEQQAKIKKIQEDARPKDRPRFDPNQSDEERQAAFKKMREKFEQAQKDCLAVLSDEQMLDWTEMCGKEFKFPERQFGGNRRGPRGGPSGPGGGQPPQP